MNSHVEFMGRAVELATENVRSGHGGPFGAVVVQNGRIIACGVNEVTASNDPTAHAEIMAIRAACRALDSFQLSECTVYASCEPCPMCLGALYWARPEAIFYANTQSDAARVGFDDSRIYEEIRGVLPRPSLRIEQIEHPLALESFRLWAESGGKIKY